MKKSTYDMIVGIIGDTLANNIFSVSQFNLSDLEFAKKDLQGYMYDADKDNKRRNWTISNSAALARSGYKTGSKRDKKWVVGYDAPYAYDVDRGTGPRTVPPGSLLDWGRLRKTEILRDNPDLDPKRAPKEFWTWKNRYAKSRRMNAKVTLFCFRVWLDIKKNGLSPNFFWSDTIYTTVKDSKKLIGRALEQSGGFRVVKS